MINDLRVLFTALALGVTIVGCSLFSRSRDAEVVFEATEVGTPEGEKVTRDMGPAGGTLSSPDGRLTLTVPQDALAETVAFSIQPITNTFPAGLGLSYRLEPEGKTFDTPLDISVHYDEHDLKGTFPEALSIAYQDQGGSWHMQKAIDLDKDKKTITVSTTHFSVFDLMARTELRPMEVTLHVGESVKILARTCDPIGDLLWLKWPKCTEGWGYDERWKLVGEGKLTGDYPYMIYTAPGKKPTPNIATVSFYKKEFLVSVERTCTKDDPALINLKTGKVTQPKCYKQVPGQDSLESVITILDRGYKARGKTADMTYSGVICSLDAPFKVIGTLPMVTYPFEFTPNGNNTEAGTVSFAAAISTIKMEGTGMYTIEGKGSEKPRIVMTLMSAGHTIVGSKSGGGTVYIDLVPLETGVCD